MEYYSIVFINSKPMYYVKTNKLKDMLEKITEELLFKNSLTHHPFLEYKGDTINVVGFHKYFLVGMPKILETISYLHLSNLKSLDGDVDDFKNIRNNFVNCDFVNTENTWFNPLSFLF